MIFNAKNGTSAGADYIRFGTGKKTLIMLPGLGDGLRTTKGTALPLALYYRSLTRDYTVYVFSRKAELPKGHTTRDMALDLKEAMTELRIQRASLVGVSMGGMIAQHFAAYTHFFVGFSIAENIHIAFGIGVVHFPFFQIGLFDFIGGAVGLFHTGTVDHVLHLAAVESSTFAGFAEFKFSDCPRGTVDLDLQTLLEVRCVIHS